MAVTDGSLPTPWRVATVAVPMVLTSALVLTPTPANAGHPTPVEGADIVERLEAVPGLTVVSEQDTEPGFRHFLLHYEQPADHGAPGRGTFNQRMTLLHRGLDRPTVLHTSGYGVHTEPFRAEPTRLVDGNQLSTEQRFFEPSRPDPADWTDLEIRQAATDHHRIITALDEVYERDWISTGASKGGMTSVYHRRFYPDDLDGTVAYVAPNDADDDEDSAYLEFFDEVGTDPQCQQDLETLQRQALERREELVGHYEELAAEEGWTFHRSLGSADAAFEMTVLDTPWAFWQYQTEERCGDIPGEAAGTDEIAEFLDDVYGFDFNTDQGTESYVPYYYQAATQLGFPSVPTDHIDDLLQYPGLFGPSSYVPDDIALPEFDRKAMRDIDRWVHAQGDRLLFVDGEFDPWGAEPFRVRRGERDTLRFVAPEANHGASIEQLRSKDQDSATDALRRWAGVNDEVPTRSFDRVPVLDDAGERERQRRTP